MKLKSSLIMVTALIFVGTLAVPVSAQDVLSARAANKQLYRTGKKMTEVRIVRRDLIPPNLIPVIEGAAKIQKYYEAFAVSPTEGISATSAFQAINFHTIASANAAAVSGCNAKKKAESEDCVVVAEFLPKGYDGPRAFSLSAIASKEFSKKYRRSGKQRAFAISPATGFWGRAVKANSIEAARTTAVAECKSRAAAVGGQDCVVVSEN
ncbi:MAG: hypothetical protein GXP05_09475 [Alphaproteobacteria bacterium]|nr:hypothetical protein [Alphaproteobacteria bacterium]